MVRRDLLTKPAMSTRFMKRPLTGDEKKKKTLEHRIKHTNTNSDNFPSLNLDKTQLKLFTNFLSIPFDYLLISRVTLRKN